MTKRTILTTIFSVSSAIQLSGADFSFYSALRAGMPGAADYEIGLGSNTLANDVVSDFGYQTSGLQFWRAGGQDQNFRIGWNASTNSAYVTVWNAANVPTTATMSNPGPALGTNAIWTLPASSMLIWALGDRTPSSIQLSGLTLSPNTALVSGALPATLGASQTGNFVFNTVAAPIVINPAANGGNWYLDGRIQFTGLITQGGNARQFDLQFLMLASGTSSNTPGTTSNTPEPSSLVLFGGGLIAIALMKPFRRLGSRK